MHVTHVPVHGANKNEGKGYYFSGLVNRWAVEPRACSPMPFHTSQPYEMCKRRRGLHVVAVITHLSSTVAESGLNVCASITRR
jgi:hypothetical protein